MTATVPDADRDRVETLARRYARRERAASYGLALTGGGLAVAGYLVGGLAWALVVGIVIVVLLRAPLLHPHVTAAYETDADPEAVRAAVIGPYSPLFALAWGRADAVHETDAGGRVTHPYLFGLREATFTWEGRETVDGLVVEGELDGDHYVAYDVEVDSEGDRTVLRFEGQSRRVGLNRLPQLPVARDFRDDVWAAQGYDRHHAERSLV